MLARIRVIVADDDAGMRQRLSEILTADYDIVAEVENGQQLIDAVKALHPDLVVIDVTMPVLNGLEALRQIKEQGIETKAVFFTGNASPAYVRRAFQNGARGFVSKGSGIEDLPNALKAVLAGETFVSPGIGYPG
jgi:DNA-binding NarL/FixJ family response regulator